MVALPSYLRPGNEGWSSSLVRAPESPRVGHRHAVLRRSGAAQGANPASTSPLARWKRSGGGSRQNSERASGIRHRRPRSPLPVADQQGVGLPSYSLADHSPAGRPLELPQRLDQIVADAERYEHLDRLREGFGRRDAVFRGVLEKSDQNHAFGYLGFPLGWPVDRC